MMVQAKKLEPTREEKEYFRLQYKAPQGWKDWGTTDIEDAQAMKTLAQYRRSYYGHFSFRMVRIKETITKEVTVLVD